MMNQSVSSDASNRHPIVEESNHSPTFRANFYQTLLLGLAMKFGGCSIAWSYGLVTGFWEYFLAVAVVGIGYLMLGLCMAEMVSIITFDGGYYGYARVILGPLGGYLVGCSGLMESVFAFAVYQIKIAELLETCFDINSTYNPLVWFLLYVGLIFIMVLFTKYFWEIISVYSVCVAAFFLIYLFGSIPSMDFGQYALMNTKSGFTSDPTLFLDVFRLSVVFFMGFDLLTLSSSEVKESKKAIPLAMIYLIGTLLVLALWLMFTAASQSPGVTIELYKSTTFFPQVFGFMKIFNTSYKPAMVVSGLPCFGAPIAYLYLIARQVKAMASSGLLPSFFGYSFKIQEDEVPIAAYIIVCMAGYAANFFALWVNLFTASSRAATIAGCFVYLPMFLCYVIFQRRFSHMERAFTNPLGIYSAIIGSIIFSAILIILIAFHLEFRAITILYLIYMAVMLLYYYCYAESHQRFSASEQKVFFKAYLINFHLRKKKSVYQKLTADASELYSWLDLRRYSVSSHAAVIHPSTPSNHLSTHPSYHTSNHNSNAQLVPASDQDQDPGSRPCSDGSSLYLASSAKVGPFSSESTNSVTRNTVINRGNLSLGDIESDEMVTHRFYESQLKDSESSPNAHDSFLE